MQHLAQHRGLDFTVDSCGTHGYHIGDPPDPRTIDAASQQGVDLSYLAARKLTTDDFERFDYLFAMDNGHLNAMRAICPPQYVPKLHLFLDALYDHSGLTDSDFENDVLKIVTSDREAPEGRKTLRDVPDPYYGAIGGFAEVYDLIHAGCEAILDHTIKSKSP
jgi:protein-tyrosine phosphatase